MCRDLAKQHVDEPDVPAAPDGASGYAEWVQIALILYRVELEKSLRETEDYLNEMPNVLAVFDLNEAPHYSTFCRWEQDHRMRELRPPAPLKRGAGGGVHAFDTRFPTGRMSYSGVPRRVQTRQGYRASR